MVTGHLKMLDMIRKHTVEGSGNHRTIMPMIDRCKEMLRQFKPVTNSFVRAAAYSTRRKYDKLIDTGPTQEQLRLRPSRLLIRIHVPRLLTC